MSKRLTFLSAAALSLSLMLPAQAEDAPNAATVVATVNGIEITLGHLAQTRATLPQQYQQLPAEVLFPGLIDQIVQQTLLSETVEVEPASIAIALENQRRALRANTAIEAILAQEPSDADIQAAYDEAYGSAEPEREYNASHILVETEEAAIALVEDARGGADFADLAKEHSTGPSGPNGGSLGWFGAGMMVPAFEAATFDLEVGAISDPVETQFGWHVIKLNEVRNIDAPSLEQVRGALVDQLQQQAVDAKLQALTAAAVVDRSAADGMDPAILDQISLDAE